MTIRPQNPIRLGPFELERAVARGGMGVVYRGVHVTEKLPVAVKVLTAERAREQRFHDGFRLEVEALARMNHPGIATVLDVGRVRDEAVSRELAIPLHSPWLAMEFVEGENLALPAPSQGWAETKRILLQLLDALAHAHALEVVHRDLKPSNILVANDASHRLKLVDFGIALPSGEEPHQVEDASGVVRVSGTPRFMAPEQVLGLWRDQGPWTDLYSLGCIGWGLVTGKSPFDGNSSELLVAHVRTELPDFEPIFAVPSDLEAWLRGLLAKSLHARYRRSADAAYDLLRMASPDGSGEVARPTGILPHDAPTIIYSLETTLTNEAPEDRAIVTGAGDLERRSSAPPTPMLGDESSRHDASPQLLGAGLGLFGLRVVPVVGRERERRVLWDTLRGVRATHRPLVTILRGPAGCGKTRLGRWLASKGHEVGALTTLHATHSPFGGIKSGLGGMLSRHFQCAGLSWGACFERMRNVMEGLGFADAEAFYDAAGFADMMVAESGESEQRTGFNSPRERNLALHRLLDRLAAERAVLLLLDDVEWGENSLSFVRTFLEQKPEIPVMIVITCRDEVGDQGEELQALIDERAARILEVGPLRPEDQRELVERLLRLEPEVASQVIDRTEGNPLFAVQLVGDWVERDLLEVGETGFVVQPGATLDVPDDVHELWRQRIERILEPQADSQKARHSLELAAALGKEVNFAEWRAALTYSGLSLVEGLLEKLQVRGLIHRTHDGWAFTHTMLHESVVRAAREGGRLAGHHGVCADALLGLNASPGRHVSRRIAEHLIAAEREEEALEPLFHAALEARRAGDNREASALLARQASLLDSLSMPDDDRRRGRNLWARAAVFQENGEPALAAKFVEAAIEAAHANEWKTELGQALRLRGNLFRDEGEFQKSLETYDEAAEVLAQTDDAEAIAQNHVSRAGTRLMRGELAEARDELQRAFFLFGEIENESMRAKARHLIGYTWIAEGKVVRAREALEDALALAREANNRALEANCWNNLGEVARIESRWEAARQAYREAARLWGLSGHRDAAVASLNMAIVEIAAGETERARPILAELEQIFERTGFRYAMPVVLAAWLCCEAADQKWEVWDTRIEALLSSLEETKLVEKDIAWLTERAGTLARDAGERGRALAAFRVAQTQWSRLGSDTEASAVQAVVDTLELELDS